MKFTKTFVLVSSISLFALTCGIVASTINNKPTSIYSTNAAMRVLTLDSSTAVGLTNTPSSGEFTTKTPSNNDVNWYFNNAKANKTGLMTLVRSNVGNNMGNEAYLENKSPITSLESIDLQFVGSYVTLYGSINGVDFERVKTVSSSGAVTDLDHYFYVRICSGNQDESDLQITSVSIAYSCNSAIYTPEYRDSILTSGGKIDKDDNGLALMETTDHVFDETRSTTALKINQNFKYSNIYNKYTYIKMNNALAISDALHSKLSFRYSTSSDAKFASADDGTTVKDNFTISIKLLDNNWKEVAPTQTISNIKANVAYTEYSMDLSGLSYVAGKTEIGLLRVSINRVLTAGAIYLDDFHFVELDSYPSMSYHFNYPTMNEDNDLSNNAISICYGGVTDNGENTEFVAPAREGGTSIKSRKATIESDWKMWNFAGMTDDLKNKEITFDLLADQITTGKTQNAIIQLKINGAIYKTQNLLSLTVTDAGITKATVVDAQSRTWTRITIDASRFAAANSPADSSNIGFNLGYAKVLYVDNVYIGQMVLD